MPRSPLLARVCIWLLLSGTAAAARAELVVFADGRIVKAVSHKVQGDRIEVDLPGGGSYSFDQSLVERIVEDEVTLVNAAPPAQQPLPAPVVRHAEPVVRPAEPQMVAPPQTDKDDLKERKRGAAESHHGGGGKRGRTGR